ncbi:hypothetical protein B0A49_09018 [Cryomyces minteri]|uniref:TATA-binding protein interacting (TIP20) domain-containing protein n=1 Tax=Cryomyces minteri TaxID=331657 RepID=A0A4U0WPN7_9PEZI|nr:hypothetical protein B0A49_09018 [Cryomyces minteri]
MASAAVPANPTSHNVALLLPKLNDADSDIRYMSLNDLHAILQAGHPTFLSHDYTTCARVVEGLLHTMVDTNGDVQNMAVKTLGPFVNRAPDTILCPMIEKISNLETGNTVDHYVPALALRAMVVSMPRPVPGGVPSKAVTDAYTAISKTLIPRLIGYNVLPTGRKDLPAPPKGMLQIDIENGSDSNAIDVLTEVARCYGQLLKEPEVHALQKITMEIIESDKSGSVLKKKAVVALSALAPYFSDGVLSLFVTHAIESLRDSHVTPAHRKLYINILGSLARSIPRKFGPYLKTLTPFILQPVSAEELEDQMAAADEDDERDPQIDEVREAALVALEACLASCTSDMLPYTSDIIEAATRFLKYDPNYADDENDDTMGETQSDEEDVDAFGEDEDFEEETGFDDEDDVSWKVRRCSAKLLYTLISTRGSGDLLEDGTLYTRVAPALVARFREREENVRLEVLSTLASLVRKTGDGATAPGLHGSEDANHIAMGPPSRKRRRGGSDAGMSDPYSSVLLSNGSSSPKPPPPQTGPQASLAKMVPEIVRGVSKLLKMSTLPTKQAVMTLLKDIVIAQQGGLSDYASHIFDPVIEIMKTSNSHIGSSAAVGNSVRVEALQLLGVIAESHPSQTLQPYLGRVIPALRVAAKEKYSKVSSEAIGAIEQYIKALTPPRSSGVGQQNAAYLENLYDVIVHRISAADTDTEVRQHAIHALGLLIGRTSGSQSSAFIVPSKRKEGLDLLSDRLRNELTRLASVRAIEDIALHAQKRAELPPEWVRSVSLELGVQLRKASRSLRGASLSALRRLAANPASRENLDDATITELVKLLIPLLTDNDLHLLGPALVILGTFAQDRARIVMNEEVINAVCFIVKTALSGGALDALLASVKTFGEQGVGQPLMQALLKNVGIGGNPDLLGKVIGTLLVSGGSTVGVKLNDFVNELNAAQDDQRKCLALSVLGEAGLRMGSASPLPPQMFMSQFSSRSEKVPLAAAVALGRAGAGNISTYLPAVLSTMNQSRQYLLLHTVREILQHNEAEADILPYSKTLWEHIIAASQNEDNKAIGAECIGRLAIIDPKVYLPQLQTFLNDRQTSVRGMVISALRFTFADTDEAYDENLRPIVVEMLTTMLNESDLENRRLALTTLNSAVHNKPGLIVPHLGQLLPLATKETMIKPELVREVTMGPFKHKVDDGLELRKSAYETLYALMLTAFSRLSLPELYDRVVAGVGDDHDIRILCILMLTKLITLAPEETVRRLDSLAEHFRVILSTKSKDNAVKQELEKSTETNKAVVKASVLLNREESRTKAGESPRVWSEYWEWVRKEFPTLIRGAEDELKAVGDNGRR